jgi:hypothetical protein
MRAILRDPAYGTRSRFPNDGIGRMPDMRRIYDDLQNVLALADPYP